VRLRRTRCHAESDISRTIPARARAPNLRRTSCVSRSVRRASSRARSSRSKAGNVRGGGTERDPAHGAPTDLTNGCSRDPASPIQRPPANQTFAHHPVTCSRADSAASGARKAEDPSCRSNLLKCPSGPHELSPFPGLESATPLRRSRGRPRAMRILRCAETCHSQRTATDTPTTKISQLRMFIRRPFERKPLRVTNARRSAKRRPSTNTEAKSPTRVRRAGSLRGLVFAWSRARTNT